MADVSGRAVQARDIRGGIHFHGQEPGRSPAPIPRQLPGDVRGFVNRTGELELLSAPVQRTGQGTDGPSEATIHVIASTAAVGKTALALRWAHRVRSRFPGGQLHIDLQGSRGEPPHMPLGDLIQDLRDESALWDALATDDEVEAGTVQWFEVEGRNPAAPAETAAGHGLDGVA